MKMHRVMAAAMVMGAGWGGVVGAGLVPTAAQAARPARGGTGGSMAGAGFTTALDATLCTGGSTNNCNLYQVKPDVYLSGGPVSAALAAGRRYTFAVLAPGAENGGFVDGAPGNLHDAARDPACNRTFRFDAAGNAVYPLPATEVPACYGADGAPRFSARTLGTRSDGKRVLPAAPFADTPNPGGVYILAICEEGATSPHQCKFDAFKVRECTSAKRCKHDATLNLLLGSKFYDANLNGVRDTGEALIPGWPVEILTSSGLNSVAVTDASGSFSVVLADGSYTVREMSVWTVPFVSPTKVADSGASGDPAYFPTVWFQTSTPASVAVKAGGGSTSTVTFGNVCLGPGGGHTPGGWSNTNTANDATCQEANFAEVADLVALTALPLVHTDATPLDFCALDASGAPAQSTCDFLRLDLNTAMNASNMAAMLSRHLGAATLNTAHAGDRSTRFGVACTTPFAARSAVIFAPGTRSADAQGFATLGAVIDEARAELGAHPCTTANGTACGAVASVPSARGYQAALKNALAAANEDRNFLQASYDPAVCAPPPVSGLRTSPTATLSGAAQSL